ncbi:GNAT family N-acetyltransferase [Paenibacillus sp. GYB003]|uniref:GNAT family N-acetyltransferase n=1 Tax=Paenibacillus sp. GYB003 TaxID=2994392 RepID=UPI002F9632A2
MMANVTPLKMLEAHGETIECRVLEERGQAGVLLALPTEASAYDRRTYPDADYIVMIDCQDEALFRKLVRHAPAGSKPVFKLNRPEHANMLAGLYRLERTRAYVSYTAAAGDRYVHASDARVVAGDKPDDDLMPFWMKNGYEREEIERYFRAGAASFTIREDGRPVSTCLAFPNYKSIWEIGAVHTAETHRGRGLAKRVVGASVGHVLAKGLTPRYQTLETNEASIRLARSVGLVPFVMLEHYWAEPLSNDISNGYV